MDGAVFSAETLRTRLAGRRIGSLLHCLAEVDSTNRRVLALAREGAPEGTVVLADRQTRGRGRLGRSWQSPPGCNLYASILLRPRLRPEEAARITLLAGVAVAETVDAYCRDGVGLKWPNDVRIGGRKVAGILTEMRMAGAAVAAVVVGIGLNVNMEVADFDTAHRDAATSLREAAGKAFCRITVACDLLRGFDDWYGRFQREGFDPIQQAWMARSELTGQEVRVRFGDRTEAGRVEGIDAGGALLLRDGEGMLRRVTAGDATLVRGWTGAARGEGEPCCW